MIKKIAMMALAAGALGALAGCAKGPDGSDGGPVVGQAKNRLTVSMALASNINSNYYYDFAFDDDGDKSDGPVAITQQTAFQNGVVGGSFTVLVQYHGGQFNAYRRTRITQGDEYTNTEDLQLVPNAFVAQPSAQSGKTLSFTLNLDATYTDRASGQDVRLFRSPSGGFPTELDVNFVTTDELRRDPNQTLLKNYDAFGYGVASSFFIISNLGLSQQYTSQSSGVNEKEDDVTTGTPNNNLQRSQLDISDFSITVLRSS